MSEKNFSICIHTLGCRANQYESDAIAAALCAEGFRIVTANERADVSIINTCTVTAESDRKSRQLIRRCRAVSAHVIVTGCFAEISPDAAKSIDGVDAVIGNKNKSSVIGAVKRFAEGSAYRREDFSEDFESFEECGALSGGCAVRARAYVKIEDGCDNRCAYCIIPKARGPVRSKSPEDVISEIEALASSGVCEVILTGIETASYGRDFGNGYGLYELLRDISLIGGIKRIGMGSLDPSSMRGDFPKRLSALPNVLPHFHISLQSGSSEILAAMRRRYNASQAKALIENIRSAYDEVTLSCDIIAGFPGESDKLFSETAEFLREARFLHIHAFPFSPREGTEAVSMPDQVPVEVRRERVRILSSLDEKIRSEILSDYVIRHRLKEVNVLAEKFADGKLTGHTEHFIETSFEGSKELVGKICRVTLSETADGKCFGVWIADQP